MPPMRKASKPKSAMDVAKALISFAGADHEGEDLLTNLRLQKLLYYVQGWSLALRGRAIFHNRIEAWPLGPVVPDVWRRLKKFGPNVILPSELGPHALNDDELELVQSVWDEYKQFSASKLTSMTHLERPWREAREGLPPTARSSKEIDLRSMKEFFSSLSEDRGQE